MLSYKLFYNIVSDLCSSKNYVDFKPEAKNILKRISTATSKDDRSYHFTITPQEVIEKLNLARPLHDEDGYRY